LFLKLVQLSKPPRILLVIAIVTGKAPLFPRFDQAFAIHVFVKIAFSHESVLLIRVTTRTKHKRYLAPEKKYDNVTW
jgi:hypothetical protein